jgi:hypothetical protein
MSQFDISNKVPMITRGGTGIGRTVVIEFAKAAAGSAPGGTQGQLGSIK